ncbi:MAG: M48 family metallopeptidase [Campylobacterales bacterium]|nr:M48 family metallopeptidase [Campylobacterales bacterium]
MKRFEYEEVTVEVTINRRNRNSYLRIGSDGLVRLSTPLGFEQAQRLIQEKMAWIRKKKAAMTPAAPSDPSVLWLDGRTLSLEAIPELQNAPKSLEREAMIERFYLERARALLPVELEALSQATGLYPSELRLRRLKRQWGNCNTKGRITLNTHLLKLRPELRRYVIAHELCHLRHMNHSRAFYELLHGLIPEGAMLRRELRQTRL